MYELTRIDLAYVALTQKTRNRVTSPALSIATQVDGQVRLQLASTPTELTSGTIAVMGTWGGRAAADPWILTGRVVTQDVRISDPALFLIERAR